MTNCPCQELTDCKKQIADMQAEMVILARRNYVCGTVFDSMRAENKRLQGQLEEVTRRLQAEVEKLQAEINQQNKQLAISVQAVRCEKCKHSMADKHADKVRYICKNPRGLSRISNDSYCSFGEVDDGT